MKKIKSLNLLLVLFLLAACSSKKEAEKFLLLNNSLEWQLDISQNLSENALYAIKNQVSKEGNTPEGLERIKLAEELKKESAKMIGEINKIKRKIMDEPGGGMHPKTGMPKYPTASVNSLSEKFVDLEKKLNAYTVFINKYLKNANAIALRNLGNGLKNESFYQYYFQGSTVATSLAMLTYLQIEVNQYEMEVLKKYSQGTE